MLMAAMLVLAAMTAGLAEGTIVELPQIDSSTARIPITDAIYKLFTGEYGASGPEPMCSKTHGAWLNLADGTADILFLIAPTQAELEYLTEKGVDIEMKVFGYDGLVFLGNASNYVDGLTSAEIRGIYSGRITNWEELDGPDAEIRPYIRNQESGSQRLFENLVWTGYQKPDFAALGFSEEEMSPASGKSHMLTEGDMGGLVEEVIASDYAIGFNIMSYVDSEFMNPEEYTECIVTIGSANLRTGPGLNYDVVAAVEENTTLTYLDEDQFDERDVWWYKVDYEGQPVWVSSKYSSWYREKQGFKLLSVDGAEPTTQNFASGAYPFVTTSYVVIRADEPADSPARKLYDWVGSDECRKILAANSTLALYNSDSVVIRTRESDMLNQDLLEHARNMTVSKLDRSDLYAFTQDELEMLYRLVYAASGAHFEDPETAELAAGMPEYADLGLTLGEAKQKFNNLQIINGRLLADYLRELQNANANRANAPRTLMYEEGAQFMTGDDVRAAQTALAAQGYLTEADCDGVFGPGTAEAVLQFQKDCSLEETGKVDLLTRILLVG